MKGNLYWLSIDSRYLKYPICISESENNLTEEVCISPTNSFSLPRFQGGNFKDMV